jgi:hypothetical protein
MPRICLFATKRDYEHLVAAQDLFANLYFVEDKYYPEESLPVIRGLLALPDLGVVMGKYQSSGPRYWVLRAKPNLRSRRLPDFDGKRRFEIDGNTLPEWIQFEPNGLFGEKSMICGHLETTHPKGDTVPLFREISKAFAKAFTKAKYFRDTTFVGSEALALQKNRYRLCHSIDLPRADDFEPGEQPKA